VLFNAEDKALDKNLHQFKNTFTSFTEDTDGIVEEKLEKQTTEHLTEKRFRKHEVPTEGTRAAD